MRAISNRLREGTRAQVRQMICSHCKERQSRSREYQGGTSETRRGRNEYLAGKEEPLAHGPRKHIVVCTKQNAMQTMSHVRRSTTHAHREGGREQECEQVCHRANREGRAACTGCGKGKGKAMYRLRWRRRPHRSTTRGRTRPCAVVDQESFTIINHVAMPGTCIAARTATTQEACKAGLY